MEAQNHNWSGVNSKQVQEALESDEFIHGEKDFEGVPIFTFRHPGENIEGYLRAHSKQSQAYRYKTARLEFPNQLTGKNSLIAFRVSGMLADAFKKNHLWGQYLRITYQGSQKTQYGHAKKIYSVEVDKGCITPDFRSPENAGKHTNSKPRKPKPIRRPTTTRARKTA